jgi:cytochrome b pre-mRNA-processing protein 3
MDRQGMVIARLKQLWGGPPGAEMRPLYQALITLARDPAWYRDAKVPDTFDGRFEMLTLATAAAMLRLEQEGQAAAGPTALLTECFVADMEAQIREVGIGDVVVGKHMGKMMSALGGRIAGLRAAQDGLARAALLTRTAWFEQSPEPEAVAQGVALLEAMMARLERTPLETLKAGQIAA